MRKITTVFVAGALLVATACSKSDKKDNVEPPAAKGVNMKVDGTAQAPDKIKVETYEGSSLLKIRKSLRVVAFNGKDKGIIIGIELKDGKVAPGTYNLKPGADKYHTAHLFYSEQLDKDESINYASYYVPIAEQDGQVVITKATDHEITGTFRGKVLTAFGQVSNPTKVVTEGTINVTY